MKKIALLVTVAFTLCLGLFAYADTPAQTANQDAVVAADDSQAYEGDICELSTDDTLAIEDGADMGGELDAMTTQTCSVCTSHAQCDTICGGEGGVCLRALGTCGYWNEKLCVCF